MVCNNQSPTGKFSIGKSPKIASNYIILEDWMFDLVDLQTKKELSAIPLHVYALVYGFSKHNAGMFIGSREYIAKRLHISLASCYRALEVLQKNDYVRINECYSNSEKVTGFAAVPPSHFENENFCDFDTKIGFSTYKNAGKSNNLSTDYGKSQSQHKEFIECAQELSQNEKISQNEKENSQNEKINSELSQVNPSKSTPYNKVYNKEDNKYPSKYPSTRSKVDASRNSGSDDKIENHLKNLMALALNKRSTFTALYDPYVTLLKHGYTPSRIEDGYRKYLARYKDEHDTPRYVMTLEKFLTEPCGLRFYMQPVHQIRDASLEIESRLKSKSPEYAKLNAAFVELQHERFQAMKNHQPDADILARIQKASDKLAALRKQLLEDEQEKRGNN